MDDKEFLELLAQHNDCPETLVKMAETDWQKQVAVEFVLQDKKVAAVTHDVATMKKIVWGIFGVTALALVAQLISSFLGIL